MKKYRYLPVIIIALLLIGISLAVYVFISATVVLQHRYQLQATTIADNIKKSRPLNYEVIQDICKKLDLPTDDKRCKPGVIVHDVEFYEDIRRYFQGLPVEKATKDEVDRILGPYLVKCSPLPKNANTYFGCTYDLSGNNLYPIVVEYDIDMKIKALITAPGSS